MDNGRYIETVGKGTQLNNISLYQIESENSINETKSHYFPA